MKSFGPAEKKVADGTQMDCGGLVAVNEGSDVNAAQVVAFSKPHRLENATDMCIPSDADSDPPHTCAKLSNRYR